MREENDKHNARARAGLQGSRTSRLGQPLDHLHGLLSNAQLLVGGDDEHPHLRTMALDASRAARCAAPPAPATQCGRVHPRACMPHSAPHLG